MRGQETEQAAAPRKAKRRRRDAAEGAHSNTILVTNDSIHLYNDSVHISYMTVYIVYIYIYIYSPQ